MGEEKLCKDCNERPRVWRSSYCKECSYRMRKEIRDRNPERHRTASRRYHQNNPEKIKAMHVAWRQENLNRARIMGLRAQVKRRYGLTLEEANVLRQRPCEICGRSAPEVRMCIDHVEDGSWLGVLCDRCNRNLETFSPNHPLYALAVGYVARTRTRS